MPRPPVCASTRREKVASSSVLVPKLDIIEESSGR